LKAICVRILKTTLSLLLNFREPFCRIREDKSKKFQHERHVCHMQSNFPQRTMIFIYNFIPIYAFSISKDKYWIPFRDNIKNHVQKSHFLFFSLRFLPWMHTTCTFFSRLIICIFFSYGYLKNLFYILYFSFLSGYCFVLFVFICLFRVFIFCSSFVAIFNEELVILQFSVVFYCFLTVFSFLSFILQKRKQSHYWFVFLIAIQR
jgi:hypothetical protein